VIVNVSRGIILCPAITPSGARSVAADQRGSGNGTGARPTLRSQLTLALADIGAVKFGEFTLHQESSRPIYIDCACSSLI